jgi:hypothetical protein
MSFKRWYSCNKVIERKTSSYKINKVHAQSLFKQKRSVSKLAIPESFLKIVGDTAYELEVYPKCFYFERITEKGERPH